MLCYFSDLVACGSKHMQLGRLSVSVASHCLLIVPFAALLALGAQIASAQCWLRSSLRPREQGSVALPGYAISRLGDAGEPSGVW